MSHNNIYAQTYDTITEQIEINKNNPQIQLGRGIGFLTGMAVDPSTNKIYVSNSGSNTLSIIDSDSGNVTNIPVGTLPAAISVSSSTHKIYVANFRSNTVSVINGLRESQIPVGTGPYDIVIASSVSSSISTVAATSIKLLPEKIYVANIHSNTISVINATSDKVISTIPVGKFPSAISQVSHSAPLFLNFV